VVKQCNVTGSVNKPGAIPE